MVARDWGGGVSYQRVTNMREPCGDETAVLYPDCSGGYTNLHVVKWQLFTGTQNP